MEALEDRVQNRQASIGVETQTKVWEANYRNDAQNTAEKFQELFGCYIAEPILYELYGKFKNHDRIVKEFHEVANIMEEIEDFVPEHEMTELEKKYTTSFKDFHITQTNDEKSKKAKQFHELLLREANDDNYVKKLLSDKEKLDTLFSSPEIFYRINTNEVFREFIFSNDAVRSKLENSKMYFNLKMNSQIKGNLAYLRASNFELMPNELKREQFLHCSQQISKNFPTILKNSYNVSRKSEQSDEVHYLSMNNVPNKLLIGVFSPIYMLHS